MCLNISSLSTKPAARRTRISCATRRLNLKPFLEFAAEALGADYIATGHYVQRREVDGQWQLMRGLDNNKDQSYFLYTIGSEHVAQTLFPVGHLEKPRGARYCRSTGPGHF